MMESYSEQGQDVFAFEHCATPGTFLDVGGWDPIKCNNSYALEKIGWRGMILDIDSRWVDQYKKLRKNPFLVEDAKKAPWKSLFTFYDLPLHVDYLSLDVDDHENLLKSVDILINMFLAGLSFRAITVEHDAYRLGDLVREPVRRLLLANGYVLAKENISCHPGDPAWAFEDWFLGAT
jgi:hypothetical protein